MKVSEAKTKVCPFMNTDNPEASEWIKCICGDCIAWEYTWEKERLCGCLLIDLGVENKYKCSSCNKIQIGNTASLMCENKIPIPDDEREGYCKRLEK